MLLSVRELSLVVGALALLACDDANLPHTPIWGKERCGSCAMLVDDRRFAGQAVSEKGEHLFFDDPGCLATYVSAHPSVRHAWLLDEHGAWMDAAAARFESSAKSPMDYGFQVKAGATGDWRGVVEHARAVGERGAR
jgi:hypothetical protein